jgi:hypothetical protein
MASAVIGGSGVTSGSLGGFVYHFIPLQCKDLYCGTLTSANVVGCEPCTNDVVLRTTAAAAVQDG